MTTSSDQHDIHGNLIPTTQPTTTTGKPISLTKSTSRPPVKPNCAEITSHFRHTYTSPEHLEEYLDALQGCPLGSHVHPPITPPSNWIIDKQIYYTMVDRFYSEFYRTLPGTGNIDWVVTLNSYVTIQSLLLANNYMESNRVMNAFLQCGQQLIPSSFIKPELLRAALILNKANVYNNHLQYLWDSDSTEEIQSYYKLPIADCTFTKDFKLVIRILIPVKVPDVETRLLQVRTFPFMEKLPLKKDNSDVTRSHHDEEYALQLCKLQSPGSIEMIQSNFGLLFENKDNCASGKLCGRNNLNSFLPLDGCISSILSGNESLVKGGCRLGCFPVDERSLPIFQRTSSDTFLAVGTSKNKIFIQCNGQPLEKLDLVDLGVLEIKLSCNCQISYRSLVLQPSSPCSREEMPKVRRLLPLHWNDFLTGRNNETVSLEKIMADEKDNYYHYDVDKHDQHQFTTTTGGSADQHEKTDRQISIQPTQDSVSTGMIVQISLLWILVVVLIVANAYLFYELHRLLQWKKIQVYKDTRIVYSVPPSPQFPNKFWYNK